MKDVRKGHTKYRLKGGRIMILNYMTETVSARNMDNGLLPKWAENEHLFNCDGNVRGLFREFIIDRLWRIFK